MNDDFYDFENQERAQPSAGGLGRWLPGMGEGGWLDNVRHLWQWDELAAEIGQESQARVALVGLPTCGKSVLFNRLRGWTISGETIGGLNGPETVAQYDLHNGLALESLGLFVLADLPAQPVENGLLGPDLLLALGDPALVVYLLDGQVGVRPADFRWVAALRAGGRPLIVALNKIDALDSADEVTAQATQKLGMPVIPISAEMGTNVEDGLLPAMLDAAPRLAVPLGRELLALRRVAARRVIRQSAILSGLMGAQPVPMLDIPLQAMVQVGVVMRVGAAYGQAPTGGMNREVMGTVIGVLGLRYLALALVKFVPVVGSVVSGVLCALMTILLGETAIRYYEAGGVVTVGDFFRTRRVRFGAWWAQRRQEQREKARQRRWLRARPASVEEELAEEQMIPVMEPEQAGGAS
jgi:small GTP-binding protein